jgi:uncharacterized protein YbjT (DUF2867 family)
MILVVGSTGMVGSEVCRLLAEKKQPFKALVRSASDPAKLEKLKALGAMLAVGDVREPETLKAACIGVDTVICTLSSMPFAYQPGLNDVQKVDLEGAQALIDAAKETGVKHFIYTSLSKNMHLDYPLNTAKRLVEKHLIKSGLIFTILHLGYFMEVWLSTAVGFDAAGGKAQIYGTGEQPISWISFKDAAKFAAEAVTNPAAHNATLELGGPEPISPHRVIGLFEKKLGKTFEVTHVPVEALQGQYLGVEDPMQKSFIGLMIAYTLGDPIEMSRTLQAFPLKLISLKEFVEAG